MRKHIAILFFVLLPGATISYAQNCNCKTNFEWVKKTFEENDAGFQYALKIKGEAAYADLNKKTAEKVQDIKSLTECTAILFKWLQFFRSGHIGIRLNQQSAAASPATAQPAKQFADWETYKVKDEDFKKYLDKKTAADYEGIWETAPYKIGIKKDGDKYIGFIIESGAETWTKGQIKLRFSMDGDNSSSVFYMRDHTAVESSNVTMIGKNHLQVGSFNLSRIYPVLTDDQNYTQYFKALNAQQPYLEQLNETTLYLRVPSFDISYKHPIDSILKANNAKILGTKKLIIDIRNNGGGSDDCYSGIIPYLYTNPIRTVGVEFLSTKLNNQRMLDFIDKPEYGFDEDSKKWAKKSYDTLQKRIGQFVSVNQHVVSVDTKDTVYPYPEDIGIIINENNGSTAEQFLLEAKQSKKVKLFGVTTFGVLDISNMYFVDSPCKEFQLGYSLSRSRRIPNFTIDEKGLQPDFYLDKTIPPYEWTNYVNDILNGKK